MYSEMYAYMLNDPSTIFFNNRGVWYGNAYGLRRELYEELDIS
jgi:hypothetical protein